VIHNKQAFYAGLPPGGKETFDDNCCMKFDAELVVDVVFNLSICNV
jgi:hypothetical protein